MVGAPQFVATQNRSSGWPRWFAAASAAVAVAMAFAQATRADSFVLTTDELARLDRGEVVLRKPPRMRDVPSTAPAEERDTVRAAVRIAAPPATVFSIMVDCAAALEYVPHLRRCRVIESAPDGKWQLIEQRLDYAWYAPAMDYVLRADYDAPRSVAIKQVRGDFAVHEGRWMLEPSVDGSSTLLRYQVRVVPPSYVPAWLQRRTLERELPDLLSGLRARAEQATDLHSSRP
jgi:ribosome-associated toxin RatA of RatAB toxin-antitoxin module